jgi:nitroreductase
MNSIKPADTRFAITDLLANRWSPRAFEADRPLGEDQIGQLFEAARWAPSSFNGQPWRYRYAVHGTEGFATLVSLLTPHNESWAQHASLLILALAKTSVEGREAPNAYAQYDLGAANFALTTQATAMGLHVHQMAGFDKALAKKTFTLPDDLLPTTMVAVGHRTGPDHLPEPLQEQEAAARTRLPMETLVQAV